MIQQPIESLLARSWRLLSSNWNLVVPGIVIGAASGIVVGLLGLAGHAAGQGPPLAAVTILSSIVSVAAIVTSLAYTTGMAQAAWDTGKSSFEDGRRAFRENGLQLFLTLVVLSLIGMVALLMAIPTLGLSVLAFGFFFLYTTPIVVVYDRTALEAVGESWRFAAQTFASTLLIVIVMCALAFAAIVPLALLAVVPLIGPLLSAALLQGVLAYFSLLLVGELRAHSSLSR